MRSPCKEYLLSLPIFFSLKIRHAIKKLRHAARQNWGLISSCKISILLEMWYAEGVVASLTFHPVEKFLVIAKYNQLFFWDWENQEPKLKVEHSMRNTNNTLVQPLRMNIDV